MHEWADHRADCVVDYVSFLIGKAWEAVVIRESQMGQKRRVQHHRLIQHFVSYLIAVCSF